ncbi:M20 metallopeptidase family protein [Lacrimispora sp. 210928-DFI.3.58]|uniref:M20 metallopeptidase family protein n=1 Tax=Lacrimispora sp. 210928-DFI.3.58 TaxID=2883214 RepID=UPI001D09967D|nr:amidohydrolase [Lacrimispora sp. 210928-DFI.3.58]MCB7317570.1 amidohydrolase [Lacrimispora sp. 210928-DFI.3.58]
MTMINTVFLDQVRAELPPVMEEAVKTRRYLHMNPEVGFDTQNTERLVRERLTLLGIELLPAKMGVMGVIRGQDSSRMVALRADMDALPIEEENDVPYRSRCPGKMHACGHDGHTSMLLGAARLLKAHEKELPMDVLLIFQPAEEGPNLGGARVMLADLKEKGMAEKIVRIFGLHLFNDYPLGTICAKYGAMASSTDEFDITVIGRGGHAGQPHKCIDALSIGAKVITAMESYMSRRMDPFDQAIFSVGIFQAGSAKNVVAETARIAGTIRCQREETRAEILKNMEQIVNGICSGFGADCRIDVLHGLPVLVNDKEAVEYSAAVAQQVAGKEHVLMLSAPMMGAEDFAYFAEAVPASFLWIGSGNPDKGFTHLAHQPKFDFDEDAMANGIQILCGLAANMK